MPYYYAVGHQHSYTTINTAIGKPDHGPRTFVTKSVHQILAQTFTTLAEEDIHLVYGEGSWGETYATQSLLPHRTHKNGLYLDIFLPVLDQKNQPAKTVKSDYDLSHVLGAVQPVITLVCLLTFFAHSDMTFLFR